MRSLSTMSALALVALSGCHDVGEPRLSRDELMDPQACARCHPDHVRQWSGSMHAYAAEDPFFLAMNALGQEETNGALGDFCIRCHAPLAVQRGWTVDGLNLDEIPDHLLGVTCYFCHSVDAVDGEHNNPLRLADDGVLRGGIEDPVEAGAHASSWSPLHDRTRHESASLCGSCHDIVTPKGVHLERTFAEWRDTLYGSLDADRPMTCGQCHMSGRDDVIAQVEGAPLRRAHGHAFPGVDLALTPFP